MAQNSKDHQQARLTKKQQLDAMTPEQRAKLVLITLMRKKMGREIKDIKQVTPT